LSGEINQKGGNKMKVTDLFGEVVYSYTRQQAIEDGVLVDVSPLAREAGFKIPVALTSAVYGIVESIPKCRDFQDVQGRLWDVLWMGSLGARNNKDRAQFVYSLSLPHMVKKQVYYQPKFDLKKGIVTDGYYKERNVLVNNITLKMVISGGDNGEPVITIMLPNED
jgi:hypothetical protein